MAFLANNSPIVLTIIFSCIPFLLPQPDDNNASPEYAQISPSPSDLPLLLDLAKTFSETSFGIQQEPLQDWLKTNVLEDSLQTLRRLIIEFQRAVSRDIDRLNQTDLEGESPPNFLSDVWKFTIIDPGSFEENLQECGILKGFIPYSMHLLQNAINQNEIPSPMYISQQPVFRSLDVGRWQTVVTKAANRCAVWQRNQATFPEITAQTDCTPPMPSICIQSVGTATYTSTVDRPLIREQLVASIRHVFYLLSQLLTFPFPEREFASDISIHITEAATYYTKYVEDKDDSSYKTLLAAQHCTNLIQLALSKSQHSESWKTEGQQQSHLEKIQKKVNEQILLVKSLEARFQSLEANQSRFGWTKNNFSGTQSSVEGSGISQHNGEKDDHQNGDNDDHDDDDGDGDNDDHHNAEKDDHQNGDNDDHDDGDGDGDNEDHHNATSASSNIFTWDYWFGPVTTKNDTIPDSDVNLENPIELSHPFSNDNSSFPFHIYTTWRVVRFWPFTNLLTFAAFHLLSIIEVYLNLLWKIVTVILLVYVYLLSQRVKRLEFKCKNLNQSALIQLCPMNSDGLKHLSSRHARRAHHHHQLPSDPQSSERLLKNVP